MNEIVAIDQMVYVKNNQGKREQTKFKFPQIIQTKETFCIKHNKSYKTECHYLPSGREYWTSCAMCKPMQEQQKSRENVTNFLMEKGMKFDRSMNRIHVGLSKEIKGEWIRINAPVNQEDIKNNSKTIRGY